MQDAPPFDEGEMPEHENPEEEPEEVAELKKQLASVTKSYDDLRPHADRAFSAQSDKESENQELRARLAVLERETELSSQVVKDNPYSDENFFSEEDKRVMEDFPEVMKTSEKLAERMVRQQLADLKRQQTEDVDKKINSHVDQKYQENIDELNHKIDLMSKQTYFDGRLGFGVWPTIEDDKSFIDFVNDDTMRRLGMTQGDLEAKATIIQSFLENKSDASYQNQRYDPQGQRRNQASQLLGGSQPQPASSDPTHGLSGEALFDALPE